MAETVHVKRDWGWIGGGSRQGDRREGGCRRPLNSNLGTKGRECAHTPVRHRSDRAEFYVFEPNDGSLRFVLSLSLIIARIGGKPKGEGKGRGGIGRLERGQGVR